MAIFVIIIYIPYVYYSAFILEFYIAFDIIQICLTGDCFINNHKLRDRFKSYEKVPSIRLHWINLFVFQTPDENRFAKEIGLECDSSEKMTFSKF